MSLEYGIIGNCRSCALVKQDSTMSWLCLPRFDSPSVFAKLLDPKGGECTVVPSGKHKYSQAYIPNTAVLRTRFVGNGWAFSVYDFFPRYREEVEEHNHVVRLIKREKGTPHIRIIYNPRPDYARKRVKLVKKQGMLVTKPKPIYLRASIPYEQLNKRAFKLEKDCYLIISERPVPKLPLEVVESAFHKTVG